MKPAMNTPCRVLFVCTGNSARSILAEATLNHLGAGRFVAYSAGSRPTGRVNAHALRQLDSAQISTRDLASKSWDAFSGADAAPLDVVITVCDSAAQEACPVFFGDFVTSHWGLFDPAAVGGSEIEIAQAFAQAHRIVRHRIEQLISLPLGVIDRETLRAKLDAIGESMP